MKKWALLVLTMIVLGALVGCNSTATVWEYDKEGNVTKKIVTSKAVVDQITESTKNKTIYIWSNGWVAVVQASMATTDTPTPTIKIYAGNICQGLLSLHKDQKNLDELAKAIKACNSSSLSVTGSGIESK